MNYKKGFTLIELLVVIAIIGLLSAIVLASLSTARTRGVAASVQSQLSSMRAQAELFYSTTGSNSSYGALVASGACVTTVANLFGTSANSLANLIGGVVSNEGANTNTRCAAGASDDAVGKAGSWVVAAVNPANTANYFCVDSTGTSKESAKASAAVAITVGTIANGGAKCL